MTKVWHPHENGPARTHCFGHVCITFKMIVPRCPCQGGATQDQFNPTGVSSKFVVSYLFDHVEYCDMLDKDRMVADASV
jgi:hypothetical protein